MNPGMWIPFMLIAQADKSRRSRLTEAMIPSMVGLPPTQQVAVTAIAADQQIRNAEVREQRVASEVISAITTVAAKPAGSEKKLTDADINAMPNLSEVVHRLPDLRTRIDTIALAADQQSQSAKTQAEAVLAEQAVKTVEALSAKYVVGGAVALKLTAAELEAASPQLHVILSRNPALLTRITQPAAPAPALAPAPP